MKLSMRMVHTIWILTLIFLNAKTSGVSIAELNDNERVYTNNLNKLDSYDWIPSAYGTGNYKERFAETFVQYIFSPVELKKASPSA